MNEYWQITNRFGHYNLLKSALVQCFPKLLDEQKRKELYEKKIWAQFAVLSKVILAKHTKQFQQHWQQHLPEMLPSWPNNHQKPQRHIEMLNPVLNHKSVDFFCWLQTISKHQHHNSLDDTMKKRDLVYPFEAIRHCH